MSSTGASTSGLGDGDQLARNLAYLEGDEIGASEFNWGRALSRSPYAESRRLKAAGIAVQVRRVKTTCA